MLPSWQFLLGFAAPVVSKDDITRGYAKRPTITDYLPWHDYNDDAQVFLLEDQKSLGVCLSIKPVACEAKPFEKMETIQQAIAEALKNSIPLEKSNPWIVQVFVKRENKLAATFDTIKDAVKQNDTPELTKAHLTTIKEHLDYITQPGGVFYDQAVTNAVFRGGRLKVMLCLYRRITEKNESRRSNLDELLRTTQKLSQQLSAYGIEAKQLSGSDAASYLIRWFNPKPKQTQGDTEALIKAVHFPKQSERPFGWDFTEQLFFSAPESFDEGWLFDSLPHKVMTIQSLSQEPEIGHLSAERQRLVDDKVFVLVDHLPDHSIFVMNIVFQALSGPMKI